MQMQMHNAESLSQEQIREFLDSGGGIEFSGSGRQEIYAWTERVLVAQEFASQSKNRRGLIRAYIEKMTGLSASHLTRLMRSYRDTGRVEQKPYRRYQFSSKYTAADVELLAEVDRAHERMSGPATRHILEREYKQFGQQKYVRVAEISVAHLYNLRNSQRYRKVAAVYEPTRPTPVSIGERRKPDPQGRPGYLRVDTVHQATGREPRECITAIVRKSLSMRLCAQALRPILRTTTSRVRSPPECGRCRSLDRAAWPWRSQRALAFRADPVTLSFARSSL